MNDIESINPQALDRASFDAARLMAEFPPVWRHRNKAAVFSIACPPGCRHRGRLEYARWAPVSLPAQYDPANSPCRSEARASFYDYRPHDDEPDSVQWHVNFADPVLFCAYGSSLFAQDEMQVAEHPALGALYEALHAQRIRTLTEENGRPTPVTIYGVERRCRVATDMDPEAGRPQGLYGNAFADAPVEAIARATTRIDPPTITHLIAMAAPGYGQGKYQREQIEQILVTAFTGFSAAAHVSASRASSELRVVIHSGFWGCGAFGGNRVLMVMLQSIAAKMAGVNRLILHTGNNTEVAHYDEAHAQLGRLTHDAPLPTPELIGRITALGLRWGVSDGN